MRGLYSLLVHSLTQVCKSVSLFFSIGSGFTEKS